LNNLATFDLGQYMRLFLVPEYYYYSLGKKLSRLSPM
jgi:hypothetical protein